HKTAADVRQKLVGTGELPQLESTTGRDGKVRPTARRRGTSLRRAAEAPAAGPSDEAPDGLLPSGAQGRAARHLEKELRAWEELVGRREEGPDGLVPIDKAELLGLLARVAAFLADLAG